MALTIINTDSNPLNETNVNWFSDGERANAVNLNRPIQDVAIIVNANTAKTVEKTSQTGSIIVPSGTTAQQDVPPQPGYFRFNTQTAMFEGYNGVEWGAIAGGNGTGVFIESIVTATAGQTVFNGLTYAINGLEVFMNGVRLVPTDYTAVDGVSVTLVKAALAGDEVSFISYDVANFAPQPSYTYTETTQTATASQTVFTVSYTVGALEVYSNGVKLNSTQFTATDGTSVTLGTPATVGDKLTFVAYRIFAVANSLTLASLGTTVQPYNAGTVTTTAVQTLQNKTLQGVTESLQALPANNIDCSVANYFTKTITASTTFTVSNVPAAGKVYSFILELVNGGSQTITWFGTIKWNLGTPPTLTAVGEDVLQFYTYDGGTTWVGLVLAKAIA